MSDDVEKEDLATQPANERTFSHVRELLLPLKRPDTESFEDYKARRRLSNEIVTFYLKHYHWPKVDAHPA